MLGVLAKVTLPAAPDDRKAMQKAAGERRRAQRTKKNLKMKNHDCYEKTATKGELITDEDS
jgi:hypothetical protein